MGCAAVYDKKTGEIISVFESTDGSLYKKQGDFVYCDSEVSDLTHYVKIDKDKKEVREKKDLNSEYELDGLNLWFKHLPVKTKCVVGVHEIESDEEGVLVSFEIPGVYYVFLHPPLPYKDEQLEIYVG